MRSSLIIATFFYLGNARLFPGTITSLVTLILWHTILPLDLFIRCTIFLITMLFAFLSIKIALPLFEEEDPQSIVIDEVVGMSIPLLFISGDFFLSSVAFILFRILDILKPSIIYYSQSFRGVYGILGDDILAGIITALIIINYT